MSGRVATTTARLDHLELLVDPRCGRALAPFAVDMDRFVQVALLLLAAALLVVGVALGAAIGEGPVAVDAYTLVW